MERKYLWGKFPSLKLNTAEDPTLSWVNKVTTREDQQKREREGEREGERERERERENEREREKRENRTWENIPTKCWIRFCWYPRFHKEDNLWCRCKSNDDRHWLGWDHMSLLLQSGCRKVLANLQRKLNLWIKLCCAITSQIFLKRTAIDITARASENRFVITITLFVITISDDIA